ncbi:uncharacterized protein At5g48480 [Nicotiana tabacum]|uniref:Uncharacterized protein At5g48480 n=1 Tax=Nicotiana tabacum TaxID=4097 RepID=A0A1S4A8J4_TOBAC
MALEEAQNGGADLKEATKTAVAAVTFTAVKPQLFVEAPKAKDAAQFYKAAFGVEEVTRVNQKRKAEQEIPLVSSVELKLGSSSFLVSNLTDDDSSAPVNAATTGCVFCLETEDVEAAVAKAVSAGAVSEGEIAEGDGAAYFGGRVGKLKDPYGYIWMICSPVKKSE